MLISQRMRKDPVTVTPDMTVQSAANIMKQEGVHRLPVLDKKKHLVGVITEKGILLATPSPVSSLSTYEMDYLVGELKVKDVMDKNPVTITTKTTVEEAARLMADNDISTLCVMDGKNLVGIVTKSIMFKLLLELFGARQYGVMAEVLVEDKPGVMTKLLKVVANQGLDVISCAVTLGTNPSNATISIKVRGSNPKEFRTILEPHVLEVLEVHEG